LLKRYEILKTLPAYGPMYILVTYDKLSFTSEGFVVRFFKSDKSSWTANFKPGCSELNKVFEIKDQQNIIVIAGGACYIMNPDEYKPLTVLGNDYVKANKSSDNKLVLQGSTTLTIIEPDGEFWNTEPISFDGFKDLQIVGNIVSGLSYNLLNKNEEWTKFIVDLEKHTVEGGSINQYKFAASEQRK
jgi:hypothetical protein